MSTEPEDSSNGDDQPKVHVYLDGSEIAQHISDMLPGPITKEDVLRRRLARAQSGDVEAATALEGGVIERANTEHSR